MKKKKKKNITVCACIYVSQSDYLSCDLYKQRSGTRRERENESLSAFRMCTCDVNVGEKE